MIELPKTFQTRLDKDSKLSALVTTAFHTFEPVLRDNRQLFFEDYTNHSERHIQRVLEAAAFLVTEESLPLLSPKDIVVLSLACLSHDLALQFDVSSFLALLGDPEWATKWKEYWAEARRWDEAKNRTVLGQPEPVELPKLTEQASVGWTKAHRNLIGEFLRRHHTRLAKEICLEGFPLLAGPIRLEGFDSELLRFAGQVAESHGLDLRKAYDLVDQEAEDRQGLHLLYLMGLLRVADYLDLKDRGTDPAIRTLHSPFSRSEHRKHLAIKSVLASQRDPQSIQVTAKPTQVEDLLALRSLFADLQGELDRCWACFGEWYGAHVTLKPLGLRLRRVRSNLDDLEKFAKTVDWVPQRLQWDVAGGEVMKLLVGPLYGERPAVGIRELMQNALDAVREARLHLGGKKQHKAFGGFRPQEAEVLMVLEETAGPEGSEWFFTISDQGIGMDLEVIGGYFLKAGASYRYSTAWKGEFQDDQGQAKVVRSGRFGVGAFAAFLLGHKIEVETRKLGATTGYRFSAGLENQPIQVTQNPDLPFGTQVKIRLHETAAKWAGDRYIDSDWFWYLLSDPQVERVVRLLDEKAEAKRMQDTLKASQAVSTKSSPHRAIPLGDTGFLEVLFFPENVWGPDSLFCNGILVGPHGSGFGDFDFGSLMVTDPNGDLPLNLSRDGLAQELPFAQLFRREFAFNLLAFHLRAGADSWPKKLQLLRQNLPGFPRTGSPFYLAPEGVGLMTQFPSKQFLMISTDESWGYRTFEFGEAFQVLDQLRLPLCFGSSPNTQTRTGSFKVGDFGATMHEIGLVASRENPSIQFHIDYLGNSSEDHLFWREVGSQIENLFIDAGWTQILRLQPKLYSTSYLPYRRSKEFQPLTEAWNEVVGEGQLIPYDLEERKPLLEKAWAHDRVKAHLEWFDRKEQWEREEQEQKERDRSQKKTKKPRKQKTKPGT